MKYAVSLLLGALLGALIALLFAPSSGQELRSNIKIQADAGAARAKEEWNKSVRGIQERVNKLNDEKKQPAIEPMEAEATA